MGYYMLGDEKMERDYNHYEKKKDSYNNNKISDFEQMPTIH